MPNETAVTVVGNLTAAPEVRFLPSGTAMARFTVASTPRVLDRASGEYRDGEPMFMPCTAWRELAEHVTESLPKGARVVVVGRLRQFRWETDEGEKRSMLGLEVDEIGPSLRFATAKVTKLARSNGFRDEVPPDDAWANASHIRPQPVGHPVDPVGTPPLLDPAGVQLAPAA